MRGSRLLSTTLKAFAGLAAFAAATSAHALAWYFQTPGSQLARDIDHLHQYVMWLIIVIFVGVFGFMFYACYAHRKSKGHPAEQFHENTSETEPLVTLRYFGPEVNPTAPAMGAYRKYKFN